MMMCSLLSDFYPRKIKVSNPRNFVSNFNTEFNMADFCYYYKGGPVQLSIPEKLKPALQGTLSPILTLNLIWQISAITTKEVLCSLL